MDGGYSRRLCLMMPTVLDLPHGLYSVGEKKLTSSDSIFEYLFLIVIIDPGNANFYRTQRVGFNLAVYFKVVIWIITSLVDNPFHTKSPSYRYNLALNVTV